MGLIAFHRTFPTFILNGRIYPGILCGTLSVPHNIVIDLNDVMTEWTGRNNKILNDRAGNTPSIHPGGGGVFEKLQYYKHLSPF